MGDKSSFRKFGLPEYVYQTGKDTTNTGYFSCKNINTESGDFSAIFKLDEILGLFDLDNNPISFMKIDVEGSELDVIRGSTMTLSVHNPIVQIEFNRHTTSEEDYRVSFDILTDLGYRCFSIEEFHNLSSVEHFIELYYIHESEKMQLKYASTIMQQLYHL